MKSKHRPTKHNQLAELLDNLDIPTLHLSSDLLISSYNKTAKAFFHAYPENLLQTSFKDLCSFYQFEAASFLKSLNNIQRNEYVTFNYTYNNQSLQMIISKNTITNNDHDFIVCIKQIQNLSETNNKTTRRSTKEEREYLEKIIACMPGNVYWMDNNCITLGCNDNTVKMLGLKSRKDVIGLTYEDFAKTCNWTKKQAASFKHDSMEVIKTGAPKFNVEEPPLPHVDGTTLYYLTNRVPIFGRNKEVIGVVGISFDITERKKEQQELEGARIKEKLLEEKLEAMNAIAASIAHELRTPLAAISKGTSVGKFLPRLVEGYEMAAQAKLPVPFIRKNFIAGIKTSLIGIKKEAYFANEIINMLLANLKALESSKNKFASHSISKCINEALNRYPFATTKERKIVKYTNMHDFNFKGEPILIDHIISNLLRNALYYLAKAGKGNIQIWLEINHKYNELHFKDTGTGIEPGIIPKIFNHFISKTENGTGLGLAFCKAAMEKMGGTITCNSKVNEFAEFILNFPKPTK